MTSEPSSAFVWIWLPGELEPVVCGRLDDDQGRISFTYARSYRGRANAVAVFEPELPLQVGQQYAASGTRLPLCIDDAMPDSWGRRLVNHRLGQPNSGFNEITYLLESGSDRIGALDFQLSPDVYVPRAADHPTLDDMAIAAERIETGEPLDPALEAALLRGTSIGGARPKALLTDHDRQLIAKFSSTTDTFPVVQGEYVAMQLARMAGVNAAPVDLTKAAGRYALLVERFDRDADGHRRQIVSTLTVLGLTTFPEGRYATYVDLAHKIRAEFLHPDDTLSELFARIAFNILCGNTDDHGRNHAALVGPTGLELTPAYDLCPQARSGQTASQAMAFAPDGVRDARISALMDAAHVYHLDTTDARGIVDHQIAVIEDNWIEVCDAAQLTKSQRDAFMCRQFLNPHAFE
ncbi:MAG: type II toxin-antitoxin system HipA family toxin [Acidimicrobiia bacterium]